MYLDKMSMGVHSLAQIVQDMRETFAGKLDIPPPGPYNISHNFKKSRTLWLICDRSLSQSNPMSAGNERYYICYEQVAMNNNPFFFFDENKPAWKSHTTLPHSLTAALINASRPLPDGAKLCDPFVGTGTTWFEAKRLALKAGIRCSDLSPASVLMVKDNLEFFLMDEAGLSKLRSKLCEINEAVKNDRKAPPSEHPQAALDFGLQPKELSGAEPYLYAVTLLNDLKHDQPNADQEFNLTPEFVGRLASLAPIARFLFYVVLRAELRYQGSYKRKSVTFDKAFTNSLDELLNQIEQLIEVRNAIETRACSHHGNYVVYQGKYSTVVIPALMLVSYDELRRTIEAEVNVGNAHDLEPESLDLIICDPPYGFNTTEDKTSLAEIYSKFLDSALTALREKGHLIICLPAESYTGRDLPYCTRSTLVVNQVLIKAQALGKQIYLPARSIPSRVFAPPYYWEAERALRRVILHFRVSTA